MYALRSLSNNTLAAKVTYYNDHVKLKLNALLPKFESILLESYAWPVQNISDKLEWEIGFSVWNYIRPYLEALDIQILEARHG